MSALYHRKLHEVMHRIEPNKMSVGSCTCMRMSAFYHLKGYEVMQRIQPNCYYYYVLEFGNMNISHQRGAVIAIFVAFSLLYDSENS